ncbi:hypothetical protein PbB2_01599 [Candidatus Phycosocius bacilliformis]|uniref:Uncharacterized protein n=1 Tax=Candidatus Phycosocius bacilliformis TaxID=1445552 RepID=A0A2P2EA34_9PROT|nr:hypothetical protein PbB2_01599 [Candidatus Phycosocius bacilliformis]
MAKPRPRMKMCETGKSTDVEDPKSTAIGTAITLIARQISSAESLSIKRKTIKRIYQILTKI